MNSLAKISSRNNSLRIRRLTEWFRKHQRDLPWRRERTAYTALVAELMLQQTQVSRVIDRFEAFLLQFPDISTLAASDEQQVLLAWEGLGYYRRARLLHAAAKVIVSQFDARVPTDPHQLEKLPGIGRYTAGAIASIVANIPAPIVDANVRRVLARWHEQAAPDDQWCWSEAQSLVERAERPGELNESLMELGATVCTAAAPKCEKCPVQSFCGAYEKGNVHRIPASHVKASRVTIHQHCIVIMRNNRILLEQRPSRGLWAKMWQPITIEATERLTPSHIGQSSPIGLARLESIGNFVHQTTHRTVNFHVYSGSTRVRRGNWYHLEDLSAVPLSNAHRKVLRLALPAAVTCQ